jgi:hypothetical protein
MLIGMMTIGGGRTARLDRLEREREAQIAAEQARIEAARLANRSFWEEFRDHVWPYKERYATGVIIAAAVGICYIVSYYRKPKHQEDLSQGNNLHEENIQPPANLQQPNEEEENHQAELNRI